MIRTMIDLKDCGKKNLRAVQAHWQLLHNLVKLEKLVELVGTRTVQTDTGVGLPMYQAETILVDGWIHLVVFPTDKEVNFTICRPEALDTANILRMMQHMFKPGEVQVHTAPAPESKELPCGDTSTS